MKKIESYRDRRNQFKIKKMSEGIVSIQENDNIGVEPVQLNVEIP